MIQCSINGNVAYPSTSDKIKITYANQFIEDSGTYTYDISFPMSIHANQVLFGNVHRFDVHKPTGTFDDCKMYVDNRLLISGKGTVTAVTESTVKLQIVGGKSRIKYNSKFEKHYIDEIDFPTVKISSGIDKNRYAQLGMTSVDSSKKPSIVMVDLTNGKCVGQPGVALFYPIYDESHDCISNLLSAAKFTKLKVDGINYPTGKMACMQLLAVQPNLLYVLKHVIQSEGYDIRRNDFDVEPWKRLYIASARRSYLIKHALPHWSVYTFIDEFRKLFNASFVFDDVSMTVDIIATNELTSNEAVAYDCLDEYSAEFDEDGLSNLATSNIEYQFDDSVGRDWREFISLSALKQFPVLSYNDESSMSSAAMAMTTKERRCSIFKVGYSYYIWAMLPKDGNPDTEEETEQRTLCGLFNPIMRDKESDNVVDLKMIPVAMTQRKRRPDKFMWNVTDIMPNATVCMPSMSNDKDTSLSNLTEDDDGNYYVSVQDAMQGADATSTEESANETMRLMFSGDYVRNLDSNNIIGSAYVNENTLARYPICLTDGRMYPRLTGQMETVSLSLEKMPYNSRTPVEIDAHNLFCIKFPTDNLPDPSKIYVFNNRRFICQKVEIEATADGIDRLKTGYFYEIL